LTGFTGYWTGFQDEEGWTGCFLGEREKKARAEGLSSKKDPVHHGKSCHHVQYHVYPVRQMNGILDGISG
jgi:hypothetical protein